jgi:hypothetical protein
MKLKSSLEKIVKLRNFRTTDQEWELIKRKAALYTGGNVSEWIRFASIELEPKASDLVKDKPKKVG